VLPITCRLRPSSAFFFTQALFSSLVGRHSPGCFPKPPKALQFAVGSRNGAGSCVRPSSGRGSPAPPAAPAPPFPFPGEPPRLFSNCAPASCCRPSWPVVASVVLDVEQHRKRLYALRCVAELALWSKGKGVYPLEWRGSAAALAAARNINLY
jgi:hypothetical protein